MDFALEKTINGHYFTVHAVAEMGGGLEEIIMWCHTCDPEGADTFVVEKRKVPDAEDAFKMLNEFANIHSMEVPDV